MGASTVHSASSTDAKLGFARWCALLSALLGWCFDGVEMAIFPLIVRPAVQEMLPLGGDHDVGIWMGRLTALFLIGAAGGGLVFGWLGDRIGRVRALSYSILVYSVFTGLCYFATTPWHLAASRFVAALGMGGEWSLGVALVMETWPGKHRPWLAGAVGAAANVGYVLVGMLAYFVPVTATSWRWILLVGACPALLTFVIRLIVPESEPWRKAVRDRAVRPLREVFAPPLRRVMFLAILLASVALVGTWGSVQWLPLWIDQITGGRMPEAKGLVSALGAAGAIVGCFLGSLCCRFGRRAAYAGFCLLSFAVSAVLYRGITSYGSELLVATFLLGACATSFYGWLPLYLPELFPTRVRATAQGISFNFGRILAAAGALGAGNLVAFYDGDYARMGATITFVYLIGFVLVWFAPETRDKPLPA